MKKPLSQSFSQVLIADMYRDILMQFSTTQCLRYQPINKRFSMWRKVFLNIDNTNLQNQYSKSRENSSFNSFAQINNSLCNLITAKSDKCNNLNRECLNIFNVDSVTGKTQAERWPSDTRYHYDNIKRVRPNDTTKSNGSDKLNRTLSINDLLKKPRVYLTELYNEKQRERLKTLSKEEKKKNQCKMCNIYFHRAENCMFKTKFWDCYRFGHSNQKCTEVKISSISINRITAPTEVSNTQSHSLLDANP